MVYEAPSHKQPLPPRRRNKQLVIGTFIAIMLLLGCTLYYTNHLPFLRRNVTPTHLTGNSYTKGQPVTSPSSSKDSGNGSGKPGNSTSGTSNNQTTDKNTSSTSDELVAPWGTFANVYVAKLDDQMQSTCNTTPGATCQITFTNGGQMKSLDAEIADAGGAVYWSWKPETIGLTAGTWHITAKAILGSQTKITSNDPLTLEVKS